jgi:hypothetical protein
MEMRVLGIAGAGLLLVSIALGAKTQIARFPPKLPPADLVLRDGVVVTLDPLQPQVQALAIRDGRIEAMGSDETIAHYVGANTKVMGLRGAFLTPGFIEGHGHLQQGTIFRGNPYWSLGFPCRGTARLASDQR